MSAGAALLSERAAAYRPAVEAEMRRAVGEAPDRLSAWMRYHLGWEDADGAAVRAPGGKMMRPVALLLATEIAGGDWRAALPAAAAVELIHNFSLLHDDIEDESRTRRGRATLWTFAGTAQAINAGDGMFTVARLAMHRLLETGIAPAAALAAMREIDAACLRLVQGQALDIAFERRDAVDRAEYLEMTAGKTAAMFAGPLAAGAVLGGAPVAVVDALRAFGHHVGLAFQAVDDVLGIWGDPAVTGKPAGDDLRQRKMTLPVIAALESGGDAAAAVRAAYAGDADDGAVARLTARLEAAGARAETETLAEREAAAALDALRAVSLPEEWLGACAAFAEAAVGRVA